MVSLDKTRRRAVCIYIPALPRDRFLAKKIGMKELPIEKYLVKKAKETFPTAEIRKYECQRNDPDRILLLPGARCVFVETKRPGKDLRTGQERAFKRLHDLGFEAYMANTKEKVDLLMVYLKTDADI